MSTAERIITADQLLLMPNDGHRCELVSGVLHEMSPTNNDHGIVTGNITVILGSFILQQRLGRIVGAETGFLIGRDPDTVLAPDAAFLSQDRIDAVDSSRSFFPEAPSLVIEVASPSDTIEAVDSKMRNWLSAGTRLAWVVNPRGRTVTVYRALNDIEVLSEHDALTGEAVVPGFRCQVAELFAGLKT